MNELHLLRPYWLLALLPLALLLWRLGRDTRCSAWRGAVDPHLLRHLWVRDIGGRGWLALGLSGVAGILAVLALAGPAWQQTPAPVYRPPLPAMVVALDLSRSMEATDLVPSRLERARHKLLDLLAGADGLQLGLVVYAADAYVVVPLTEDADIVAGLVPALAPGIMPVQGSRPERALALAADLLEGVEAPRRDILLVSDGRNAAAGRALAAHYAAAGIRTSAWAVGTREGAPLAADGGDKDRGAVRTRMQADALQALARAGNGMYLELSIDDSDVHAMLSFLGPVRAAPRDGGLTGRDRAARVWRDEGHWLVLLLLPIAALAFRRGWLLAVPLMLLVPPPAQAVDWQGLWWRADQQAERALSRGEYARAAELYGDPIGRGVARYRMGDYAGAAELFALSDTATAHYNRGNALARLGQLEEAVAAYDEALRRAPRHREAEHNRRLVSALLTGAESARPAGGQAAQKGREAAHPPRPPSPTDPAPGAAEPPEGSGESLQRDSADTGDASVEDRRAEPSAGTHAPGPPPASVPETATAGAGEITSSRDPGRSDSTGPPQPGTSGGSRSGGDEGTASPGADPGGSGDGAGAAAGEAGGEADPHPEGPDAPSGAADAGAAQASDGPEERGEEHAPGLVGGADSEAEQAAGHLLQRVQADPAELLREKFARIQRRRGTPAEAEPW
jgi:Ca-activated chloride channel homolog